MRLVGVWPASTTGTSATAMANVDGAHDREPDVTRLLGDAPERCHADRPEHRHDERERRQDRGHGPGSPCSSTPYMPEHEVDGRLREREGHARHVHGRAQQDHEGRAR